MKNSTSIKKILIIGATGFIGYHLAKFCLKKKYKVFSISRSKPSKKRRLNKVKYLYVDIAKKKILKKKIEHHLDMTYVVNLGGNVDHGNYNKVHKSHFIGLKNLSNLFLRSGVKKFIQIGSSMEYGKAKSPQIERNISKPLSHYGKAKYKSTQHLILLKKKYNFPSIILRPYQIYGPNQEKNRIIPFVIDNCLRDKRFPCSSGEQYRDFLYISDFIRAIDKCLRSSSATNGEIINIGYGRYFKVKKIINTIKIRIKKGIPEFGKLTLRKEENLMTYPSVLKSKKLINWKPTVKFKKGIMQTINFYKTKI